MTLKYQNRWFYISLDKDGFYIELGNIDKGTSIFTIALVRNWTKDN